MHGPRLVAFQYTPGLNQPFVDAVELILVGEQILEPMPLDDRRLQQGGWGVGVILQQLGWTLAIVRQVEPPVDGQLVAVPALPDVVDELGRDRESVEQISRPSRADLPAGTYRSGRNWLFRSSRSPRTRTGNRALVPIGYVVGTVEDEAL